MGWGGSKLNSIAESWLLGGLLIIAMLAGILGLPGTAAAAVPAQPTDLKAVAGSSTSIGLLWHDNSNNEASFEIWRRGPGEANYSLHDSVAANKTLYYDSGLIPNSTYYYKVGAKNAYGVSLSNEASTKTNKVTVRVTSPNGGEVWKAGETHNITWSSDAEGFMVNIVLDEQYTESTGSWMTVHRTAGKIHSTDLPNHNHFSWTVPNIRTTRQAKIKISLYHPDRPDAVYTDTSDNYFTLEPPLDISMLVPGAITVTLPAAPTELTATAQGSTGVKITWRDNATNEEGYKVEKKTSGGSYTEIESGNISFATLEGLVSDTTYYFRVKAYNSAGDSAYSNEASYTAPAAGSAPPGSEPPSTVPSTEPSTSPTGSSSSTTSGQTVLKFYIGSRDYYLQGASDSGSRLMSMDTIPIIRGGRTLFPIRYVAEPLGASVDWDASLDQVTVRLDSKTIVMYINNGTARINGVETPIDRNNPEATPIIVPPGRTMLPLRFIAENLGCRVDWDPTTREVKIIYPRP